MKVNEIKYGIIVIDKRQLETDAENIDIVHFVGYQNPPTKEEYEALYTELSTDLKFGLTEIIEYLHLIPAPPETVEEFKFMLMNGGNFDEETDE